MDDAGRGRHVSIARASGCEGGARAWGPGRGAIPFSTLPFPKKLSSARQQDVGFADSRIRPVDFVDILGKKWCLLSHTTSVRRGVRHSWVPVL